MKSQIVLISGKMGSGKTTLANILQNKINGTFSSWYVRQMSFAEPLYDMHNYCRSILVDNGVDIKHKVKDGNLLQLLGTEWGRNTIDEDIWAKVMKGKINNLIDKGDLDLLYSRALFVIPDCRFKNELEIFPDALKVRLECPKEIRMKRAEMWRDRDDHPSEIDLDDWVHRGKFDMIFNTEKDNANHISELVTAQLMKESWLEKRITEYC